jgi:hypothetical protein
MLEQSDMELHVGAFVIYLPTMMIDERVTVVDAYTNLGTELDLCLCFATDYGSYVRLKDADDAVGTSVCAIGEHLLLLGIHFKDSVERVLLMVCQKALTAIVVDKKLDYQPELLVQAIKHVELGLANKLTAFLLHLNKYKIGSASILVRRA